MNHTILHGIPVRNIVYTLYLIAGYRVEVTAVRVVSAKGAVHASAAMGKLDRL